ncbi:DUF1844 domain-containing protein [Rhodopirellula sp. SWK7]|uniref:DUF1844 domain-containing protein n=1 Tax=Rhodopirellula sp. SWK7 TaxID=595460 RepID=UPI0002BFD2FA|nr:DUF1844 domain-containing protein [Rhodopirellula sp. SWK7]EMI42218.1 protein containing DUF1844 [Rhodopirellula sp. SWK7]
MSNANEEQESTEPSPKIIVDSDWKEQVAKEKQAAASAATDTAPADDEQTEAAPTAGVSKPESDAAESPVAEAPSPETPPTESPTGDGGPPLPTPSFEVLVSMLFTQAISALGQMPSPVDGETKVDKRMAKHTIDMLDMLTAKTEGNLTEHESKMLSEALHALRMTYVSVRG